MEERWVSIAPGDSIQIVAPSGRTPNAWADLEAACSLIRAAGFRPVYDETLFCDDLSPAALVCGFSNDDEARYRAFANALQGDSRVLWCFRGGYGADRVAARLKRDAVQPKTRKLLVGFSDITVLHLYCQTQWQWPSLHAPVLNQLVRQTVSKEDIEKLWKWLRGELDSAVLSLEALNVAAGQSQEVEARLSGGNLMVIQSTMGTAWEMPRDGIVFFEEIREAPYRVARILQQWLNSGWLANVKAVVFGDFLLDGVSPGGMEAVLQEFAAEFPRPVLRCRGIGHGMDNTPLPLGVHARLSLGTNPEMKVSPFSVS